MVRDFAGVLVRRGAGTIVVLGSVAAQDTAPLMAAYAASKAYVQQLVHCVRSDLHSSGVRVTCVQPGTTRTGLLDDQPGLSADERFAGFTPLEAADLAKTICWIHQQPAHVNVQEMTLFPVAQSLYVRGVHRRAPETCALTAVPWKKAEPMTLMIDHEMEAVARQLWPSPQRLQLATGGLFNRVVQVQSPVGTTYLKRFTDAASSGDFPPLPTSASQRCLVAANWHELALRASAREPRAAVPSLVAVQTALDLVAMEEAQGEPLYDALVGDGLGVGATLQTVTAWLGALHSLPLEPRPLLWAASGPFKAFKIDLQYTRMLPEIPQALHAAGERFVADYLQRSEESVHGDLNSRNILSAEGAVSVIDFEQGHFGEGVYDLAYLLSEYVIRDLRFGVGPEATITAAWEGYCQARDRHANAETWRRLRLHLGFQTLYRLVGPSRKVWTGHLDDVMKDAVRRWSTAELSAWLQ